MRRKPKRKVKFLLLKPGHIGDVLLMTPALRRLRKAYPDALIDVAVRRGTHAVLEENPDISRLFLLPHPEKKLTHTRTGLMDFWQCLTGMGFQRYDVAFDFSNSDRSRLWLFLSLARRRVGINAYGEMRWKAKLYHWLSTFKWGMEHQVLKDFRLVADALQLDGEPGPLVLTTPKSTESIYEKLPFLQNLRRYIVIHPTSRWSFKQWLPDRWANVADQLASRHGLAVIWSCGPDQRELNHLAEIQKHCASSHYSTNGRLSLRELAWVIEHSTLFCGVDTAAMHVAAAVQAPTVALFGPSQEWSWRPWKTRHELVLGACPCKEKRVFTCDKSRPYPCMLRITVEAVMEAAQRLLESTK